MATMTLTEARAALPHLLSRVQAGEEITITRHGEPAAVLVRPDALRSRRAEAALSRAKQIHDLLEAGRTVPLTGAGSPADSDQRERPALTTDRAEALIADIRAGRESR